MMKQRNTRAYRKNNDCYFSLSVEQNKVIIDCRIRKADLQIDILTGHADGMFSCSRKDTRGHHGFIIDEYFHSTVVHKDLHLL